MNITLNDPDNKDTSEPSSTDDEEATSWKFVGPRVTCKLEKFTVTSEVSKDPEMEKVLSKTNEQINKKMVKVLGESETDWDVTFKKCRLQENNVGSFLTDLMREYVPI